MEEEKKEENQKDEKSIEDEVSSLKEQLEQEKNLAAEYLKHLQYLKADFENYKKRVLKEKKEMWDLIAENIISGFLPIIDNFERAINSLSSSDSQNLEEFKEGINIIYREFKGYLKELGLSEIDTKDKIFSPELHEAVSYEDTEKYPHGFILEEIQKGYKLKNKVIRPSKVKVARNTTELENLEGEKEDLKNVH
jgi:molecular chaperone GrpE